MDAKKQGLELQRNDNDDDETNESIVTDWNDKDDDVKLNSEHDKGNDKESKRCHKKQKLVVAKDFTMNSDSNHDVDVATAHDASIKRSHTAEAVTFNVGGKHYDVSRSLLNSYPDTMLARVSSNIWTDDGKKTVETIFIERDGERFRWILNYMRDRNVRLPFSISKESLLHEFEYFGFDVDPQNICMDVSLPNVSDQVSYLKNKCKQTIDKKDSDHGQLMRRYRNVERNIYAEQFSSLELANAERDRLVNAANAERDRLVNVANAERDRLVNAANAERDRIVNTSNDKVETLIPYFRVKKLGRRIEYKLETRYVYLVNKCFDNYLSTNKLEWKLEFPNRKKQEFESCGCCVSHKTKSSFLKETKPMEDDLIMKRVANMFGFSHIYAFYKECSKSDSDISDESDNPNLQYQVKFGILPKTIDPEILEYSLYMQK